MAIDASTIFRAHPSDHRLSPEASQTILQVARYTRHPEESKALSRNEMPKIILSASGMATGGRVLHHLKTFAPDPRHTILFTGFQAAGTRGATIVSGAPSVKIHGSYVPIRAEVANLGMLSAHADQEEILDWLRGFRRAPRLTCITHGEPEASDALRRAIEEHLHWPVHVPEQGEWIELDAITGQDRENDRRPNEMGTFT